jgi:DNA-binding SARP family transcriptional activator
MTATALQRSLAPPKALARLSLLNSFVLTCDGRDLTLPRSAQRLIAFLALHERGQARLNVACALWLDTPEERAFASLRSALWRANHGGRTIVESFGGFLKLSPQIVVDVSLERLTAVRLINQVPGDDPVELAGQLLDAELLADWYEDWVLVERERFRQLQLHALEAACESLTLQRRYAEALRVGLAAVAAEPLRESAHRAVILVHLAEGNRIEALRQYQLCSRLTESSLGGPPSRSLEELVTRR